MLDSWSMRQKAWKKKLALFLGYRRMLDGAAFIQVLNADEGELMRPLRLRVPGVLVPNGIFLQEIEPFHQPGRFRVSFPAVGQRPFILFLSRLHYKKGLDVLAGAFAKVAAVRPQVDLVVAGPDEGAREAFISSVAEKGLNERVHLVGPLFGSDKINALFDAACFCLPSRQEGFSVAVTEALACGCPVVISEACHFPEVKDVGAGTVLPLDPTAFAKALIGILADPAIAARMGAQGRELVRQRYTWPKAAAMTLEAYAAHGRPRPPESEAPRQSVLR
jgi:glycosyltransferase involved in cell wall biosynthesis